MRLLLTLSLFLILGAAAAWLFTSPYLSAVIDQFFTVASGTLPADYFELRPTEFVIGQRIWSLNGGSLKAPSFRLAPGSLGRMTLGSSGQTFTFGPIQMYSNSTPDFYYQFAPDKGDEITFTQSRSWLAWKTPFQFNIMGGATISWRRHSYYRLLWKKSSGAAIKMVWRDEQDFYTGYGWSDANLQTVPAVTITPSPVEKIVERYLADKKGWSVDEYRLESRGLSDDGQCDVTAAIHSKDQNATHPGAGESVDVYVDRKSLQVIREVGGQ
jgi:hypothetical protein